MLTIANKGRYMVKKCQNHVYVICEGSLRKNLDFGFLPLPSKPVWVKNPYLSTQIVIPEFIFDTIKNIFFKMTQSEMFILVENNCHFMIFF